MSSLHQIRVQVVRLERYCRRIKNGTWEGNRSDLIQAMADVAEVSEISRRLYDLIKRHIANSEPPHAALEQK